MSPLVPRRPGLAALAGYHSPQVDAEVRLNANESPLAPPPAWQEELAAAVAGMELRRYPDRRASALRRGLADLHGVAPEEVFCANGSNEVLQSLLLAFGGPGRRAVVFEPTYQLHSHISRLTMTDVVAGGRGPDLRIDHEEADRVMARARPEITFACSPNNPTGRSETPETIEYLVRQAPGLVVVDEAYGQFSPGSALSLRAAAPPDAALSPGATTADTTAAPQTGRALDARGLVVVRTFSKTWAMAAVRLGYLVADPEIVTGCEEATLPYHLSAVTQAAGVLALRYRAEMEARVAWIAEGRGRLAAALSELPVESWPSDSNFLLFRPLAREGKDVWADLLARSVLVRDCSAWDGLDGCLRVTVGSVEENDRFIEALKECL